MADEINLYVAEIWLADGRCNTQNTRKRLITYSRTTRRAVSARNLQETNRRVNIRKKQAIWSW